MQVLTSARRIEADIAALSAAQAACLAAARPFAKNGANGSSSSGFAGAAAGGGDAKYAGLRHELDRAYLAACKVTEWREMIQVLVQQQLPGQQLSSLLALADIVNATLEEWAAAATTELFWLLGVDTAGLADGSLLHAIVPAAAEESPLLSPAAAAAAAGTTTSHPSSSSSSSSSLGCRTGSSSQQQQQQAGVSFTTRSSYLDLLTGDLCRQAAAPQPLPHH
ncbi:hypothetical protein COO60DRAFT_702091 [Scenedesmus sp. NREL 46B-D3]|nr:hypothetical protein COO60DRAFT_702091 [Scenedesmus sp. NREL 46B-D3]